VDEAAKGSGFQRTASGLSAGLSRRKDYFLYMRSITDEKTQKYMGSHEAPKE